MNRWLERRALGWLVGWLGIAVAWLVAALLQFGKAHLVAWLSSHAILWLIHRLETRAFEGKAIVPIVATGVSVLAGIDGVYRMFGASGGPTESLSLLLERLVAIPLSATYYYFYIFPNIHSFTYYATSRTLNLLLAAGHVTPGVAAPQPFIVSSIVTGSTYNMNVNFVGAGWGEYGYIGVLEGALIVFGALYLWDRYLASRPSTVPTGVLIAFFLGRAWNIVNGDMPYMMLAGGFLAAPFSLLVLTGHIGGIPRKRNWSMAVARVGQRSGNRDGPRARESSVSPLLRGTSDFRRHT
jgi:hypothetical protein